VAVAALKSYDRHVVWLEYLDSERKRNEGRRVPLDSCTRAPTLEELVLACRRLSLEPEAQVARYPNNIARQSGYVSVTKKKSKKHETLIAIARELSKVRGEKATDQARFKGKC
jgi:signal recognition particle subunit SEC65